MPIKSCASMQTIKLLRLILNFYNPKIILSDTIIYYCI